MTVATYADILRLMEHPKLNELFKEMAATRPGQIESMDETGTYLPEEDRQIDDILKFLPTLNAALDELNISDIPDHLILGMARQINAKATPIKSPDNYLDDVFFEPPTVRHD